MPGLFPDLLESPGINAGQQINSGKKGEGGYCTRVLATQERFSGGFTAVKSPIISLDLESGREVQDHP